MECYQKKLASGGSSDFVTLGTSTCSTFHSGKASLEATLLAVTFYARFPLSLHNTENRRHERGIDISHQAGGFGGTVCSNILPPSCQVVRSLCGLTNCLSWEIEASWNSFGYPNSRFNRIGILGSRPIQTHLLPKS
jgi:hypothetical protein